MCDACTALYRLPPAPLPPVPHTYFRLRSRNGGKANCSTMMDGWMDKYHIAYIALCFTFGIFFEYLRTRQNCFHRPRRNLIFISETAICRATCNMSRSLNYRFVCMSMCICVCVGCNLNNWLRSFNYNLTIN